VDANGVLSDSETGADDADTTTTTTSGGAAGSGGKRQRSGTVLHVEVGRELLGFGALVLA